MNAESELEAVGMAWGAAATGTPAATGSTGQGLSLMQESISRGHARASIPLVVLNMARRAGRLLAGDPRPRPRRLAHTVLAPMDVPEAVELAQLAFHLADNAGATRCSLFGDYYLAHTSQSVDDRAARLRAAACRRLGARRVHRRHRQRAARVAARHRQAQDDRELRPSGALHRVRTRRSEEMLAGIEPQRRDRLPRRRRARRRRVRHARRSTCAAAVTQLRAEGARVGYVRPITLLPFPTRRWPRAPPTRVTAFAVYENNQGQMIDDVRLGGAGARAGARSSAAEPRQLRLRHRARSRRPRLLRGSRTPRRSLDEL